MPAAWPVFFDDDQAYRLRPGFGIETKVVVALSARERAAERLAARRGIPEGSGEHRVVPVGKGYVVTYGSQIDFRAQPRATFKLIFNGMFHGPSTPVPAAQMGK